MHRFDIMLEKLISKEPDKIKIIRRVEIYRPGDILTLFYRGTEYALYKFDGAFNGISVERALRAIKENDAVAFYRTD